MSGNDMSREIRRLQRVIRADECAWRKAREANDETAASAASQRIQQNTEIVRDLEIRVDRYG